MLFDEILNPGLPEDGMKRLKNDLIYIYHYSILQSKENNLHLLVNLDESLLGTPQAQGQAMNEFSEEIRNLMKKKPNSDNGGNEEKEEIYL